MDPDVRFGKPCIVGTRIDVATIVGLIAASVMGPIAGLSKQIG